MVCGAGRMTDSYEDELQGMDEDGEIACIAQDCAVGLGKCLADGAVNPEARQGWLMETDKVKFILFWEATGCQPAAN